MKRDFKIMFWTLIGLSLLFFGMVFIIETYQKLDRTVTSFGYDIGGPFIDQLFVGITALGGSSKFIFPILTVIVLYFVYRKWWGLAVISIINMTGVRLFNHFIKHTFERHRPELEHLVDVSGFSFPSGHTMNATAFFGFLAYLYWHFNRRAKPGITSLVVGIFGLIILLVGYSRVYLGVHYVADVLGGLIAGAVWLIPMVLMVRMLERTTVIKK